MAVSIFRYNQIFLVFAVFNSNIAYSQDTLSPIFSPLVNGFEEILKSAVQDVLKSNSHLKDAISKVEDSDFLYQYKLAENNEDKYLNVTGLVEKYGFQLQKYPVTTDDGYQISVYRIPSKGEPVLLVHGLLNSAVDWLTIGRDNALPYLLADKGYDVWLMNARGTVDDSSGHVSLSPEKDPEKYWDFSFDEIGRYDLPATINIVLNVTGKSTLKLVGHSQGTTVSYVMASVRPEYNDKISLMVSLSPIAWLSHMISPLIQILAVIGDKLSVFIRQGLHFYVFDHKNPIVQILTKGICGDSEGATLVCSNIMFLAAGFDYGQLNFTQVPVIFAHTPSSVSTKQLTHYAQLYDSANFRMYDYGEEKNLEKYGTAEPPDYPVDKIRAPVALYYKKDTDWFSAYEDVLVLKDNLPQVVEFYEVPWSQWDHTDFMWAKDLKHILYDRVLELFEKY